ncbi:uncharacterized protein LOC126905646 isoform X2 [Daktulosphaira vitifoliae]|uniref:uncharacterized protein LOC126905646 isoform X2 n=1 Tax=Daktulosphaira vitifoliae TaxID=58002 RepID=UPI0021AA0031|nr:uncharacterized protein LOC126905646 isoform X2 [Daktulosphaira vitifoliae]
MDFYFCFGILLCFICLITIPTFSDVVPNFNKNELEEKYGSNEEIHYSAEDNRAINDFFIPSNQKNYPFSFFGLQYLLVQLFNISVENDKIIFKRKENTELKPRKDNSMVAEIAMSNKSDNEVISHIVKEFEQNKIYEAAFNDYFRSYDEENNGTVPNEIAKEILPYTSLFADQNSSEFSNELLKKYTNNQNRFEYEKMIKNVANDNKEDKSNILTYDYDQKVWKKLYSQ